MSARQPLADHGNITKQNGLPRCARPHGPRVSSEWVGPMSRLASKARRTAHCRATLSATPSSLASEVSTQVRGSTVADVLSSTEAHHGSTTIQAWRGCRISAKSIALQFTNSSLDPDCVEVPLESLWNKLRLEPRKVT